MNQPEHELLKLEARLKSIKVPQPLLDKCQPGSLLVSQLPVDSVVVLYDGQRKIATGRLVQHKGKKALRLLEIHA